MRKRIIAILLLITVLFFVVGCENVDVTQYTGNKFKIINDEGDVVKSTELEIKNAKAKGENGIYTATMEVGKTYNYTAIADGYTEVSGEYKAVKEDIIDIKLNRCLLNISGTVLYDGNPVPEANVEIQELDRTTTADTDGVFTFNNIPANNGEDDKYTFVITKNNYESQVFRVHVCEKQSDENNFILNNVVSDIVMSPTVGNISGKVVTSDGQNPLNNVIISGTGIDTTATNEYGNFTINNVDPGLYNLEFNYDDYKSIVIRDIEVIEGEMNRLDDIKLEALPGSIDGIISNDGRVLENVTVTIIDLNKSTNTNSNGEYKFDEIYEGNYTLEVNHSDYDKITRNINVVKNKNTTKDIQLVAKPGSIKGKTQMDTTITVTQTSDSVRADENGNFFIDGLSEGDYTLEFSHEDYKVKEIDTAVIKNDTTELGKVSLDPKPGSIEGVTIVGATVEFAGKSIITDSSGEFMIDGVEAGTYELSITHEDYENFYEDYTIDVNEDKEIGEIELVGLPGAIIGVIKSSFDDSAVQGANITVLETGKSTTSNSEGKFTLNDIEAGAYTLHITHSSYSDNAINVTVDINRTTDTNTIKLDGKPGSVSGITQPDANITLVGDHEYNSKADEDGNFTISDVEAGDYSLKIKHPDYYEESKEISVYVDDDKNVGNISLNPLPGKITGVLIDKDEIDNKIVGASISGIGDGVKSNEDGYFEITGVSVGTHTITINHENYNEKNIPGINIGPNETYNLGEVQLEPAASGLGTLIVNVIDENGNAFQPDNITDLKPNTTDWDSDKKKYVFKDVEVGSYNIKVSHEGYHDNSKQGIIISDQTTEITIEMQELPYGYLEGTLYHKDSETGITSPIVNTQIIIGGISTVTDSNGKYKLKLSKDNYGQVKVNRKLKYRAKTDNENGYIIKLDGSGSVNEISSGTEVVLNTNVSVNEYKNNKNIFIKETVEYYGRESWNYMTGEFDLDYKVHKVSHRGTSGLTLKDKDENSFDYVHNSGTPFDVDDFYYAKFSSFPRDDPSGAPGDFVLVITRFH